MPYHVNIGPSLRAVVITFDARSGRVLDQRVDVMGADQFLAVKSQRLYFLSQDDEAMEQLIDQAAYGDREIKQDAWLARECTEALPDVAPQRGYYHQSVLSRSVI